jgi:hypothetical protein
MRNGVDDELMGRDLAESAAMAAAAVSASMASAPLAMASATADDG